MLNINKINHELLQNGIQSSIIDKPFDVYQSVQKWVYDKHLEQARSVQQIEKLYEEYSELCEALIIHDEKGIIDAVGDLFVATVTLSAQLNININWHFTEPVQSSSMLDVEHHIRLLEAHLNKHYINNQINQQIDDQSHKLSFELHHMVIQRQTERLLIQMCNALNEYCQQHNFTLIQAVIYAYNEIKDRPQVYHVETNTWA